MVHDARRGGQNDVAKLTRGKKLNSPLLEFAELDGVARVDDAAFVQAVHSSGQVSQKVAK